jgi:hypothetical protein
MNRAELQTTATEELLPAIPPNTHSYETSSLQCPQSIQRSEMVKMKLLMTVLVWNVTAG